MAHVSSSLESPAAETTIAVLLGASEYPRKPAWSNPVLGATARAFRDYVLAPTGCALVPGQVLDLFDHEMGPADQLFQIKEFLRTTGKQARDLILYYVGHGGFDSDEYHLGIRSTQRDHEFITTMESRKLARIIREGFGPKRVYVILDACFAGSAARDWQGGEIELAVRRLAQPLPRQGTAFLAAASKDDVTRAPRAKHHTVFTGAILEALARGVDRAQPRISMYELYEQVRDLLQRRETDEEARPELHVPSQREGDVSRLGLFPNAAYVRLAEAHRPRPEPAARAAAERAEQAAVRAPDEAAAIADADVTERDDDRAGGDAAAPAAIAAARTVAPQRRPRLLVIGSIAIVGLGAAGYALTRGGSRLNCASDMVPVPGGTFSMGSTPGVGDNDESPPHQVRLSDYCIDKTEVTVAAYGLCVTSGKCTAAPEPGKDELESLCNGTRRDRQEHPINCVDWDQARAYCESVNKRLPSEAEWEYAARGSDGRKYPWGKEDPSAKRLNACDSACRVLGRRLRMELPGMYMGDDGWEATAPVGSFPDGASPFGALDMAGNVWEWTADWYGAYTADARTDPPGPKEGTERVNRGGSWKDDAATISVTDRFQDSPTARIPFLGFRCARSD